LQGSEKGEKKKEWTNHWPRNKNKQPQPKRARFCGRIPKRNSKRRGTTENKKNCGPGEKEGHKIRDDPQREQRGRKNCNRSAGVRGKKKEIGKATLQ